MGEGKEEGGVGGGQDVKVVIIEGLLASALEGKG